MGNKTQNQRRGTIPTPIPGSSHNSRPLACRIRPGMWDLSREPWNPDIYPLGSSLRAGIWDLSQLQAGIIPGSPHGSREAGAGLEFHATEKLWKSSQGQFPASMDFGTGASCCSKGMGMAGKGSGRARGVVGIHGKRGGKHPAEFLWECPFPCLTVPREAERLQGQSWECRSTAKPGVKDGKRTDLLFSLEWPQPIP